MMRCVLIVRDVLQFERVSFGDMWMRKANLFLQTLLGQENQGFHIIMRNHFVMVGLKYMIKWGRMTIAI